MKSTEKAYFKAAKQLDSAVKVAREAHRQKARELEAAQKDLDALPAHSSDPFAGAKRTIARARVDELKSTIQADLASIYSKYDGSVAAARRELVAELDSAETLHAADLDQKAVALLSSGTMGARDYRAMIGEFSENSTVLALIRKSAAEAAEKMIDPAQHRERMELLSIAEQAKTDSEKLLQSFDDLVVAAKTLSSRDIHGNFDKGVSPTYIGLDSWEALTSGVIPGDGEDGE